MRVQQYGLLRCWLCVLVVGDAGCRFKSSTENNGRTIYLYAAAVRVPIFRGLIDETRVLFFSWFSNEKKAASYRIAYERRVPCTTFSVCVGMFV